MQTTKKKINAKSPKAGCVDIQEKAQKPGKEETSGHNVQRLEYKPDSGGKLDRQGSFQRSRKKTAGQETEHSQKKRRQQNSFKKKLLDTMPAIL